MIKIGIPVVEGHSLTSECIRHLSQNSTIPESVEVVVIDNGSKSAYLHDWTTQECYWGVKITTIRNDYNRGYYWPLLQVVEGTTSADIVGVMHNDLFIYEKGWDRRLLDSFVHNPRLGMVGVCGSNQIDERGGRGGGTMCNFVGRVGQLQEHTGQRISDLKQALILDSMFMAMRSPVVTSLHIDDHIAPCHFYDKIWPLRAIEAGWTVGVLGLEVDHQGGLTTTGTRFENDCAMWCDKEGLPYQPGQAAHAVYLEAERRFLTEYRMKGFIPRRIA